MSEQRDDFPEAETGELREEPDEASGEPDAAPGDPDGASDDRDVAEASDAAGDSETDREESGEGEYTEETRELLQELDEVRDRHLRLAAEFENYRKRTRRELSETRERAQADLTRGLLEALDDLGRVVEATGERDGEDGEAGGEADASALVEGVELAYRKLMKELSEAGLSRIEALGQPFDPELHDALLTTPAEDPDEDEIVSRVLINGYQFRDRVIRPARVEVKKYSADSSADRAEQ